MNKLGAKVTEIQAQLGHASLHTTTLYLQAVNSVYNPHAEQLAAAFGAE